MLTLWRICSKLVDLWDTEDKRTKREIPLLIVVGAIILGATLISMGIGYLSGESPWPQQMP